MLCAVKLRGVCALCCAVLCCAVLCCAVLCCAVLCCAVLCCAVLCCAVLMGWRLDLVVLPPTPTIFRNLWRLVGQGMGNRDIGKGGYCHKGSQVEHPRHSNCNSSENDLCACMLAGHT